MKIASVLDVTYPPNINDATPIVDNIKQKSPDMVYHAGLNNDSLLFARAMKQQGYKNVINLQCAILAWAEKVDPSLSRY